eukprot:7384285-Prymnesium_polylepis.1
MIKVPAAGWTEAQRNAKIRSTPGFAELKSSVTAAAGDQPADGESRPATQTKNAVGQREMRAVREVDAPMEESRSREQTKVFMHSEYSERDDHDARRVGSRHAKVRDLSYAEATQKLEEMGLQAEAWLHEVRRVCTQMDLILEEIPPEQAAAARALQAALIELVDDAGDDDDDGAEACGECEPDVESNVPRPTGAISIVTA